MPFQSAEPEYPNPTAVYQTVSARLTETRPAPATSTPLPAVISSPTVVTSTPSPTLVATLTTPDSLPSTRLPSATSIPCDLAAPGWPSVDVTIPDGARFLPGQSFSKTWRLYNAGSCPWTREYAVVYFSGENFSAVSEQVFTTTVLPGKSIDITIDMVAPQKPGIHQSNWKLRNKSGKLFGIGPTGDAPFWVRIEVEEAATSTASPQPTATLTPTLATAAKGSYVLVVGKGFDLDTGQVTPGTGEDLLLKKTDATTIQLAPINGAKMAEFGSQAPTDQDCRAASLSDNPLLVANLKEGIFYCYRTTQVLPGFLKVKSIDLKEGKLGIEYQTWIVP